MEEIQAKRRHADINDNELQALEMSRNEKATVKQTQWAVRCFQTWCTEKEVAIDFKTVTKMDLNQTLRHFYASVKNTKGEHYGFGFAS